jgi:hypothetical protein
MPDFMRIGGVTGWLRASAIAGAAGIPMSTHLYPEVAAHVMRVTETAHWLEWQDWADPVLIPTTATILIILRRRDARSSANSLGAFATNDGSVSWWFGMRLQGARKCQGLPCPSVGVNLKS